MMMARTRAADSRRDDDPRDATVHASRARTVAARTATIGGVSVVALVGWIVTLRGDVSAASAHAEAAERAAANTAALLAEAAKDRMALSKDLIEARTAWATELKAQGQRLERIERILDRNAERSQK